MNESNKDKKASKEWTLPVLDSAEPGQNGFDPSKTGAWTAFAIGAVTKRVQSERKSSRKDTE